MPAPRSSPALRPPLLACFGLALAAGLWAGCDAAPGSQEPMQFFRGNTHTHTLWSDGDAAPEWVTAWFRERDYDFLVLSEHNIVADHERWFPVAEGSRLTEERLAALEEKFGAEAIETRSNVEGKREMRLWTLDELREQFEAPGEFLLITGEEVTDSFEGKNVHINALNLASVIPPQHGTTLVETVDRNLDAISLHGVEHQRPVLAHLNHPNFTWSLTQQDLSAAEGLRFFEVYNGHPSVRNAGDDQRASTEAMWDFVNKHADLDDAPPCFGLATDDSHHYHTIGLGRSNPGRGWIQVAAQELSASSILAALEAGAFYGSSGVELHSFERSASRYRVRVLPEEGVSYRIQFYGARAGAEPGLLSEVEGTEAEYDWAGDEQFVRAVVVSDRPHPNPAEEGEMERAWLQPVWGPARRP